MKSYLIIGAGKFGKYLSIKLCELGNEVMIIDKDEDAIRDVSDFVSNCVIADCSKEQVLVDIGIKDFDYVFVCIGEDFKSSMEITAMASELGAKKLISMAREQSHAKFLKKIGADIIVYPEKDMAEKVAVKYNADTVYDYIELTDEYFATEIEVPSDWVGKTIREVNVRVKHNLTILGIKKDNTLNPVFTADHKFSQNEHLMVAGNNEDIQKFLKEQQKTLKS